MQLDVVDLRRFYDGPVGRLARLILRGRLATLWPDLKGQEVLGYGYATPYLRPFVPSASRVVAFAPAVQGVAPWPRSERNRTALVLEATLPLTDQSVDRILVVHGLEGADDARAVLKELWRVLRPGGRLLVVTANRRGIWARLDTTPFGSGRPYSRGQLCRLLVECQFQPTATTAGLFVPPSRRRFILGARAWEAIGHRLWPTFGGVVIVEAEKRMRQGLPADERARRRLFVPSLQPEPAASHARRDRPDAPVSSR